MVAYVHIHYATYQFSEESKAPPPGPCSTEKNVVLKGLRRHNSAKHEGIKFQCHQCEYLGTTMFQLRQHTVSIHEGVRYPCDQCTHIANSKVSLKRH